MHNVSQWPNLRHLGEPLGGAEGLLEAVSLRRRRKVWVEEESPMPDGSEFHTVGAATLKPQEAKVVGDTDLLNFNGDFPCGSVHHST